VNKDSHILLVSACELTQFVKCWNRCSDFWCYFIIFIINIIRLFL